VICCTYKPTGSQVLVRAYGKKSEVIIDRKQEIMVSPLFCRTVQEEASERTAMESQAKKK